MSIRQDRSREALGPAGARPATPRIEADMAAVAAAASGYALAALDPAVASPAREAGDRSGRTDRDARADDPTDVSHGGGPQGGAATGDGDPAAIDAGRAPHTSPHLNHAAESLDASAQVPAAPSASSHASQPPVEYGSRGADDPVAAEADGSASSQGIGGPVGGHAAASHDPGTEAAARLADTVAGLTTHIVDHVSGVIDRLEQTTAHSLDFATEAAGRATEPVGEIADAGVGAALDAVSAAADAVVSPLSGIDAGAATLDTGVSSIVSVAASLPAEILGGLDDRSAAHDVPADVLGGPAGGSPDLAPLPEINIGPASHDGPASLVEEVGAGDLGFLGESYSHLPDVQDAGFTSGLHGLI